MESNSIDHFMDGIMSKEGLAVVDRPAAGLSGQCYIRETSVRSAEKRPSPGSFGAGTYASERSEEPEERGEKEARPKEEH